MNVVCCIKKRTRYHSEAGLNKLDLLLRKRVLVLIGP